MKNLMKVLSVIIVLSFTMCHMNEVYAAGIESRALMDYVMQKSSASGKISVRLIATVNDGTSTIISYSIQGVETISSVTGATVTDSGIASGGKLVYVTVEYYYFGRMYEESIYFSI